MLGNDDFVHSCFNLSVKYAFYCIRFRYKIKENFSSLRNQIPAPGCIIGEKLFKSNVFVAELIDKSADDVIDYERTNKIA